MKNNRRNRKARFIRVKNGFRTRNPYYMMTVKECEEQGATFEEYITAKKEWFQYPNIRPIQDSYWARQIAFENKYRKEKRQIVETPPTNLMCTGCGGMYIEGCINPNCSRP